MIYIGRVLCLRAPISSANSSSMTHHRLIFIFIFVYKYSEVTGGDGGEKISNMVPPVSLLLVVGWQARN